MFYFYVIFSAAALLITDRFFVGIFKNPNSFYVVPLLFIGIIIALILLQFFMILPIFAFVDTKKPRKKCSRLLRRYISSTLKLFFKVTRVKIHATGFDKIPQNEDFLLVCNHIDNLDPAFFLMMLPEVDLRFIAKKEVYSDMPFVAKVLHKLGGLPIDRENNREGAKTIIKAINIIKNGEGTIGIFPEGYTSKTGELQSIRNGSLKIATKANCKIAVCTISGSRKIEKRLFIKKTDVYLNVAEILSPEDFGDNTAELGDKVHGIMSNSLKGVMKS